MSKRVCPHCHKDHNSKSIAKTSSTLAKKSDPTITDQSELISESTMSDVTDLSHPQNLLAVPIAVQKMTDVLNNSILLNKELFGENNTNLNSLISVPLPELLDTLTQKFDNLTDDQIEKLALHGEQVEKELYGIVSSLTKPEEVSEFVYTLINKFGHEPKQFFKQYLMLENDNDINEFILGLVEEGKIISKDIEKAQNLRNSLPEEKRIEAKKPKAIRKEIGLILKDLVLNIGDDLKQLKSEDEDKLTPSQQLFMDDFVSNIEKSLELGKKAKEETEEIEKNSLKNKLNKLTEEIEKKYSNLNDLEDAYIDAKLQIENINYKLNTCDAIYLDDELKQLNKDLLKAQRQFNNLSDIYWKSVNLLKEQSQENVNEIFSEIVNGPKDLKSQLELAFDTSDTSDMYYSRRSDKSNFYKTGKLKSDQYINVNFEDTITTLGKLKDIAPKEFDLKLIQKSIKSGRGNKKQEKSNYMAIPQVSFNKSMTKSETEVMNLNDKKNYIEPKINDAPEKPVSTTKATGDNFVILDSPVDLNTKEGRKELRKKLNKAIKVLPGLPESSNSLKEDISLLESSKFAEVLINEFKRQKEIKSSEEKINNIDPEITKWNEDEIKEWDQKFKDYLTGANINNTKNSDEWLKEETIPRSINKLHKPKTDIKLEQPKTGIRLDGILNSNQQKFSK